MYDNKNKVMTTKYENKTELGNLRQSYLNVRRLYRKLRQKTISLRHTKSTLKIEDTARAAILPTTVCLQSLQTKETYNS